MEETSDLIINIDWEKASQIGVATNDKKAFLGYLSGWTWQFPLMIAMSCGKEVVFNSEDDIPDKSMPCSCGRADHWFIKYAT